MITVNADLQQRHAVRMVWYRIVQNPDLLAGTQSELVGIQKSAKEVVIAVGSTKRTWCHGGPRSVPKHL
jgi:hypothetical protein